MTVAAVGVYLSTVIFRLLLLFDGHLIFDCIVKLLGLWALISSLSVAVQNMNALVVQLFPSPMIS